MNTLPNTAFIFDVDGTLVNTEQRYANIARTYLSKLGVDISLTEYHQKFSGASIQKIVKYCKQKFNLNYDNQTLITELADQFDASLLEHPPKATAGSLECISKLTELKVQKAIASNAPPHVIQTNLQASGIYQMFNPEQIFSASQFQAWKPNPTIFIKATESFQHKPKTIYIVEDSSSGLTAIDQMPLLFPDIKIIGIFFNNGHNSSLQQNLPPSIQHSISNLEQCLQIYEQTF